MRVLHVYKTYYPETQGGLEEVIRQICLNSRSLDIESRVLTLAARPEPRLLKRPEALVVRARRNLEVASCGISAEAFELFGESLHWSNLVHYHFPWPFADVLHFALRPEKPTVLTYHSDIVRQRVLGKLYSPLMNRFLGGMDRIVCTSPNYFATSDVLPRFESKVEVIPIGISPGREARPDAEEIERVRTAHGSDFFLFVGVLRYYKGLHILLDAMRDAPYRVVIVGSGPTERELKRQAADMRLENVSFAGHVSDPEKHALYELCRGVVFPSYLRSEAFGVTLLEGAMHGKPLISTEVGSGTSHVNVDGETGLVVPPSSHRALRAAMDTLWSDPPLASAMGERAWRRYRELFTGERMGARYGELYHALYESRRAQPERAGPGSGRP